MTHTLFALFGPQALSGKINPFHADLSKGLLRVHGALRRSVDAGFSHYVF